MSSSPCGGLTLLTTTAGLAQLRQFYTPETRELFGVLLNATSAAEANLSLEVLGDLVPQKALVSACNVREILRELPASPFSMRTDETTLMRTAGLTKDIAALTKRLPDGVELAVTTAGNLVLDVIVKSEGVKHYWSPIPIVYEFVNPGIIDLVVSSEYLLDAVLDLAKSMGLVCNPKFYLSMEDFHLEYAAESIADLGLLF